MLEYLIEKLTKQEKKLIDSIVRLIDKDKYNRSPREGCKKCKRDKICRKCKKIKKKIETHTQVNAIFKSVKQNYIFYIAIIVCVYSFTRCQHNKSNVYLAFFSIVFITFYGYFIHLVSHYMNTKVSELYKTFDNIFTRNKYFNWFALKLIDFGEFHAKTHHDSDINKSYKNIALEFINNIVSQGGLIILIKYFLELIDNRVILLWAFFYATVHNINYNIVSPLTHRQHHMDDNTNYGIDIWDIMIGSKYDWDTIETHNHTAINLFVITAVILYCSNKFKM